MKKIYLIFVNENLICTTTSFYDATKIKVIINKHYPDKFFIRIQQSPILEHKQYDYILDQIKLYERLNSN